MQNLLIITGGANCEHEVSLKSFENIRNLIDKTKFNIISVLISKENEWLLFGTEIECHLISENKICFLTHKQEKIKIDIIFPIIHGQGENGTLQGMFETLNVKYVGSKTCASAITFNKIFTKIIVQSANIPIIPYINYNFELPTFHQACEKLNINTLFIKPADSGSSFGCSIVKNEEEFNDAIIEAKKYGSNVLIEEYKKNRELFCGILNNKVSSIGEVRYNSTFFDYDYKYQNNNHLFFDHNLSNNIIKYIQDTSLRLFKLFELTTYARFDYFYCENKIYLNEINSIPGLTQTSLFLGLFKESGYDAKTIISEIIESALK